MRSLAIIILLLLIIILFSACTAKAEKTVTKEITSYEECVAAGYPILKTYPPQCVTPDGKRFVKKP